MSFTVKQKFTRHQIELIERGLNLYILSLQTVSNGGKKLEYAINDVNIINMMLGYDISAELTESEFTDFKKNHGIDFPSFE